MISTDDDSVLTKAIRILNSGGVIIYPTDTVYGLGADATNKLAISKIFEIKRRDRDKPILIAVSDIKMAQKYVFWNKYAETLANKYLPGPLTIILNRKNELIPQELTPGSEKVGIRIPDNNFTLNLVSSFDKPITTTSANLSGEKNPIAVDDIDEQVKMKVSMIIDKGPCNVKVPSTVVDVSSFPPKLIREGAIKFDEIMAAIG